MGRRRRGQSLGRGSFLFPLLLLHRRLPRDLRLQFRFVGRGDSCCMVLDVEVGVEVGGCSLVLRRRRC